MANICDYKVIVKGKKNACYAFYGSMPAYNDKYVVEAEGTDDNYTLRFNGDCKWSVDQYSKAWNGRSPVALPDDPDEAMEEAQEKYCDIYVQDRSKMFNIEVLCNSADIEDVDPRKGPDEIFEHYKNGCEVYDDCPSELRIAEEYDEIPFEKIRAAFPLILSIEGTAYEGRIERIENVKVGDPLIIKADYYNRFYDPVAIEVFNMKNETLGYLARRCLDVLEGDEFAYDALWLIAKHVDKLKARVVSVTPLSQRAKNAKYALMDVELSVKENATDDDYAGECNEEDYEIDELDYIDSYVGDSQNILLPNYIKGINENAFEENENLNTVIIPEGVEKIKDGAFASCKNLKRVELPKTLREIGAQVFSFCEALESIIIPEGVETLEYAIFEECSNLKEVVLPNTLREIKSSSFESCKNLESIVIPEGVDTIEFSAFCECENLKEIKLPSTLHKLDETIFYSCFKLTNIVVPEGCEEICEGCFACCENLKDIYIPSSICEIAESAFDDCNEEMVIHTPAGSYAEKYAKEKGLQVDNENAPVILKTKDTLKKENNDISTNNVKTKPATQKKENSVDKKVEDTSVNETKGSSTSTKNEPKTVEKPKLDYVVENGILKKYTGTVKKVIIPKEIKEIADNAFADCKNLQAVDFCEGLVKIGKGAFKNTGLTYVDLPSTVNVIEKDSFDDTCVVVVNGKMPYYLPKTSEIEKLRQDIDAKDKLISETMNRKQTLQKSLDEYINAKPSEFSEIAKYQNQISEIENERAAYSKDISKKLEGLKSLIGQKETFITNLSEQRRKTFFLAVGKKKDLDEQIQKKQNELKLLYDEQKKLDEEFRTTDNNFKEKLDKKREELDALSYMQNRWEADRNAQINTISSIETELQGYIEEITSLKANLEKAEAYERTHTEWLEKKEKAHSEFAAQKFDENETVAFEITDEMLQKTAKTKATGADANASKNIGGLKDAIAELTNQADAGLDTAKKYTDHLAQKEARKKKMEDEQAKIKAEALAKGKSEDDIINMYITLTNEQKLGKQNRSQIDFYATYEEDFPAMSKAEVISARKEMLEAMKDDDLCAYYTQRFKQRTTEDRYSVSTRNLYVLSEEPEISIKAEWAIENTKEWYDESEYEDVVRLLNADLQIMRSDLDEQLSSADSKWIKFATAKEYLKIVIKEKNAINPESSNFQVVIGSNLIEVEISTKGIFTMSTVICNYYPWYWGVSVKDIWEAASENEFKDERENAFDGERLVKQAIKQIMDK